MPNKYLNTDILDRAILFAVKAHHNTERRGKGFPYIVHPMEAVEIVSTITPDQELLAAAALHDTIEDTDITYDEVLARGLRVMDITATAMCRENNLPIYVFNMDVYGNLLKVLAGEDIGTFVHA